MLVKACGLRTLKEITWAGDLGYDFFGIVVDPKSKRYVRPAELERLWASIPCEWRKRCVLVARKLKDILFCSRFCREALLQCYEPFPAFVAARRRFQPVSGEEQWQWFQTQQNAAYYLYDVSFGCGEWHGIPSWCRDKSLLFVAGGLKQERLQQLAMSVRGSRFFGLDLSSGLEGPDDNLGRSCKDYAKMQSCLKIIRSSFLA